MLYPSNQYYWIEKYALAQYHIGIERTLEIKTKIIQKVPILYRPLPSPQRKLEGIPGILIACYIMPINVTKQLDN